MPVKLLANRFSLFEAGAPGPTLLAKTLAEFGLMQPRATIFDSRNEQELSSGVLSSCSTALKQS